MTNGAPDKRPSLKDLSVTENELLTFALKQIELVRFGLLCVASYFKSIIYLFFKAYWAR